MVNHNSKYKKNHILVGFETLRLINPHPNLVEALVGGGGALHSS